MLSDAKKAELRGKFFELKALDFRDNESFWNRVNSLIKAQKLTQEAVSCMIRVSYTTFRSWSYNKAYPDIRYLYLMAQVLNTSMNYLLFGSDTEPKTQFEYSIGKKVINLVNMLVGEIADQRRRHTDD